MLSLKTDGSVAVIIRIRPQSEKELRENCCTITEVEDDEKTISFKTAQYSFDKVFNEASAQIEIFDNVAKPLIEKCLEGYNTAIFAYGQTGSGKTYTMGTSFDGGEIDQDTGLIPRILKHLFSLIETQTSKETSTNVSVQFLELYNEDVFDLLDPKHRGSKLIKIHEDASGGIIVNGCTSQSVTNFVEVLDILSEGSKSRITASTSMNIQSSRSHAIFSVIINQNKVLLEDKNTSIKLCSKFHLIDLAGSERLSRTGAVGDRAKEAISINSGLLALGNVINALGDKSRKGCHVPYRDSKLTRLLQDSLGGNSYTVMMACVSPSDCDFSETISTLNYAIRAKNIKNKVLRNQTIDKKNSSKLSLQIKILKEQLEYQMNQAKLFKDKCVYYEKMFGIDETKTNSNSESQLVCENALTHEDDVNAFNTFNTFNTFNSRNTIDSNDGNIICESSDTYDSIDLKTECEVQNFGLNTEAINQYLLEINTNITDKEFTIKDLEDGKAKYDEMMEHYELIIESLTTKIEELNDKQKDEASFKEKIQKLEEEVKEVKSNQLSYQKTVFNKEQADKQLTSLKNELYDLKHAKVSLVKQLHTEVITTRKKENEFMKKLNIFERNVNKKDNEIQNLKIQKQKTENVLRSKIEELEATKRHIRPNLVKSSISKLPKPIREISESECNKTYTIEKDTYISPAPNNYNPYAMLASPAITVDTKNKWNLIRDQILNFASKKETIVILNKQIDQSINTRTNISNKIYSAERKLATCSNRSKKKIEEQIQNLKDNLEEIQLAIENDQKAVAEIEMNESSENIIELFKTCKKGEDLYIFRHIYQLLLTNIEKLADQNINIKEQEIKGKIPKNKKNSNKIEQSPLMNQHNYQSERRKTALPQEISQSILASGNTGILVNTNNDEDAFRMVPTRYSTRRVTRNTRQTNSDPKILKASTVDDSNEQFKYKENIMLAEDPNDNNKKRTKSYKKRPLLDLEKDLNNIFDTNNL